MKLNAHINNLKSERLMSTVYSIHVQYKDNREWVWYDYEDTDSKATDRAIALMKSDEMIERVRITFDTSIKLFDIEPATNTLGDMFRNLLEDFSNDDEDDDDEQK